MSCSFFVENIKLSIPRHHPTGRITLSLRDPNDPEEHQDWFTIKIGAPATGVIKNGWVIFPSKGNLGIPLERAEALRDAYVIVERSKQRIKRQL